MSLTLPGIAQPTQDLRQLIAAGSLTLPTDFARLVYDALSPGATVVVTDEPLQPAAPNVTVMTSDVDEEPADGPEPH
jgi:hypothetical protein